MPRYVIHVGPHKTGSTYLQHNLRLHRPQLLEHGILYPAQWDVSPEYSAQARLAEHLEREVESLAPAFEAFNASRQSCVLFSSEDFARNSVAALWRLKRLIGENPVTVVFYCRDWGSLAYSLWQEEVKHGSTSTFPEMVSRAALTADGTSIVNMGAVLDRFEHVFGLESLKIVSYSELLERKIDLFQHFASTFLDWDVAEPAFLGRANESFDPILVEFIRAFNALAQRDGLPQSARVREAFLESAPQLDLEPLAEEMRSAFELVTVDETSPALSSIHKELYRKYSSCLVDPKPPEGWLFAPGRKTSRHVRSDYLLREKVFASLNALYRKLMFTASMRAWTIR